MGGPYTEADKVAAVKRCAAETGKVPLRLSDYLSWRLSVSDRRSLPDRGTLDQATGFVAICEKAGVVAARRQGTNTGRTVPNYSRAGMLRAVQMFVDETYPEPPSANVYDVWRKAQDVSMPSRKTIYRNFGDWRELMHELGVEELAHQPCRPSNT